MDNFKGTKGEWFYQEESDAYTHIVRPKLNPSRIISHLSQDTSGQAEADARLIAAAPDLLFVLQYIVANDDGCGIALGYQSREMAEQAIQKALGKETTNV